MANGLNEKTASSVLAHPVRVQILTTANSRDISPSRYVEQVMGFDPSEEPVEYKRALSHVSYHFRALEKEGCLEVVDRIPRRGSIEHVYRAAARAHLSTEEWEQIPLDERIEIMTVTWQGLVARVEAARIARTLDTRDDAWLAWTEAELDERGWAEMTETIAANFAELERIRQDSEARLKESGDQGIHSTYGMLGFESPVGVFYDHAVPSKVD